MLKNAEKKFNILLSQENVEFILLKNRHWVEAKRYPAFTLLGQSLGSIVLGFEAIFKLVPGKSQILFYIMLLYYDHFK